MTNHGYIHFLKAGIGDAFILHCRKGENRGIIVVDGGHGTTPKNNKFISEIENIESVDLMVLTHPDNDHISGIKRYVEKHLNDKEFPVKEVWANCAANIEIQTTTDVSAQQAKDLSEILDTLAKEGKTGWRNNITANLDMDLPFADISVIAPTVPILEEFIERYRECIGYYNQPQGQDSSSDTNEDYKISMKELAIRPKRDFNLNIYEDASNASSISFILRCDDFSILMLGDSFPSFLIEGLESRGFSKTNPLKVDFVKVAHHGSKSNISNDLLGMIDCQNFIISTNGHRYDHPDREAIANILCHPCRDFSKEVRLYFNYSLEKLETPTPHIFNGDLDSDLNFSVHSSSELNENGLKID